MKKTARKALSLRPASRGDDRRLYTLEVFVVSGPMTAAFVERNPVISRTIQIRSDQTLEDLHLASFHAFERDEEHMYEFQVGGKRPMDKKARRYVLPMAMAAHSLRSRIPAGDVTKTTIGSLELKVGAALGYWFDFGDDWWHQVDVVAVENEIPREKFPRIVQRVGESPPQYLDLDEEE